jgi:glutathione reductase (NADPH)
MAYDVDLFVIGAGSGGVRAARLSAGHGAKVMIAEEHRIGGTCVIRGCVPKKFFVYASEFEKEFKIAKAYGWSAGQARFDWPTLRDNVAEEVSRLSGIYARNLGNAGVETIAERAELVDAHTVRLASGRTVSAGHILVAVGGAPWLPDDVPGIEHAITSNEIFLLDKLPERILIAGGGYIAVEFAFILQGLGVDVTLLYRGDLILKGFDDDVRVAVHEALKRRGVHVVTHAVFEKIEKTDAGYVCRLSNGQSLETGLVMACMGRVAHTDGLGCEAAGVARSDSRAIVVDAYSKTSIDSIYAVGDVTNRVNLTPVAIREGAAFAATVFGGQPTAYDHADIPTAVFSQPPIGCVGLTEAEARKAYGEIHLYKTQFRPMRTLLAGDETRMLMKLVVRASDDVVVGCHLVGPDAPEIIQIVAIPVKAKLTKAQFDATCALHPTVAEELVTMKDRWTPPPQSIG